MKMVRIKNPLDIEISNIYTEDCFAHKYDVIYCGLCGTDKRTYLGTNKLIKYPVIPGHEAIISDGQSYYTVYPYNNCRKCYACQQNMEHICKYNETYGVQRDGLLRQKCNIEDWQLVKIPDLKKEYCLIEPLSVVINFLFERDAIYSKAHVGIIGNGTIGSLCKIVLEYYRCKTITMITRESHILLQDCFDLVIEASGNASMQDMIKWAVPQGHIICIGHNGAQLQASQSDIIFKELSIYGSRNARIEDFKTAIEIIDDIPEKFNELIDEIYSIDHSKLAFERYCYGSNRRQKIIINCQF